MEVEYIKKSNQKNQTGKHLLRTQNVSEQNQKQMLRMRANGATFVSATMCPRLPGPLGKTVPEVSAVLKTKETVFPSTNTNQGRK